MNKLLYKKVIIKCLIIGNVNLNFGLDLIFLLFIEIEIIGIWEKLVLFKVFCNKGM